MVLTLVMSANPLVDLMGCIRSHGRRVGIAAAGTMLVLLGMIVQVSLVSAQGAGTGVRVDLQPPAIRGAIRYGRWAPMDVVIRTPQEDGFSGILDVNGANGFSTQRDVEISAGLQQQRLTIPVFCSSQLPVFRVSLKDSSGQDVDRDQQRYASVLNTGDIVVGVSLDVSHSSMESLREELSQRFGDSVRVIAAERRALLRMGRWPGIFDLIYLIEPADLAVPVRTDVSDVSPFPSAGQRMPDVQLVDQQAYDLFHPPQMSQQRKQWFASTLTLLTIVLMVGVLFCFRDPSSHWNWAVLVTLPLLVLVYLTTRDPPSPPVIGQVVSVRVSDSIYSGQVVDRRVSLFPRGKDQDSEESGQQNGDGQNSSIDTRSVRYPIRDLRRTIPLFHSSSAISTRFPGLEYRDGAYAFHWPEFPVGGYFVLQETGTISSEPPPLSVDRTNGDGRLVVENQGAQPLNTVWIRDDQTFYRIGDLAAGETRTVDLEAQDRVDTRERFLGRAFSVDNRQQRMLSRWMKYVLLRYDQDRPLAVGVQKTPEYTGSSRASSYDFHLFPRVLMHRFGGGGNG